jgi:N6-L-threonylcarbamoyladenine synthase
MIILAIESSCDETSASLVEDGRTIISNVIATSSAMHEKWGGIVPEVAAREQLRCIIPVIREALNPIEKTTSDSIGTIITSSVDAIGIAVGPGLIGSLLIGVETAKTLAYLSGKPLLPVNHVLAHMYANFLIPEHTIRFPAVSLVVSGGHTELFCMEDEQTLSWIGGTIDDAAGEAFDKTARLIGFGSSGGRAIQESAAKYTPSDAKPGFRLPRPLLHDGTLNFSFSGLKTAITREWGQQSIHTDESTSMFAHEVQESITDILVEKTIRAADIHNAESILLGGGVASNLRLREKFFEQASVKNGQRAFFCPPVNLCTDNAAYIGSYAYFRSTPIDWKTTQATPNLSVEVTT